MDWKSESIELAAQFAEVGVDQVIDDETLSSIPLIGTINSLFFKIPRSFRDYLLLKKIGQFFGPLARESEERRRGLLRRLEEDPPFREKLTEIVPIYLDRCDRELKAKYIGILFRACLKERISEEEFFRMSALVEQAYWGDLELPRLRELRAMDRHIDSEPFSAIQLNGFIQAMPLNRPAKDGSTDFDTGYEFTGLGLKFFKIIDEYSAKAAGG